MNTSPWFQHPFHQEPSLPELEEPFIHESAYVDAPCQIGHGTKVLHFTHIKPHAVIGHNCTIGANVTIDSGVLIGNYVQVMNNVNLASGVILEDNVYFGPCALIIPLKYVRGGTAHISALQPALVKHGANIGANATIASGMTVGRYAFVESGSVVDRHVPNYAVMVGNPLQLVGWRCECGEILPVKDIDTITDCKRCGKHYHLKDEQELIRLAEAQP